MRNFLVTIFCSIVSSAFTPMAVGATLNPGDVLEVHFQTSNPSCPFGPCDALIFYPQEYGAFFDADVTAKLFDGSRLLGTYYGVSCCVPTFHSPSSLFQEGAPIDFTSIDSGTINGVIDMSIATGYLTWPSPLRPPYFPNVVLGNGVAAGVVYGGTGLQVTGIDFLSAPEPALIFPLLGCLGFLLARNYCGRVSVARWTYRARLSPAGSRCPGMSAST